MTMIMKTAKTLNYAASFTLILIPILHHYSSCMLFIYNATIIPQKIIHSTAHLG